MFATIRILAPIAAALVVAVPAVAAPLPVTVLPAAEVDAAVGTAATTTAAQRASSPGQRYCIVSEIVGSRIQRRECDTLGAWQERGVDPSTMPRRR